MIIWTQFALNYILYHRSISFCHVVMTSHMKKCLLPFVRRWNEKKCALFPGNESPLVYSTLVPILQSLTQQWPMGTENWYVHSEFTFRNGSNLALGESSVNSFFIYTRNCRYSVIICLENNVPTMNTRRCQVSLMRIMPNCLK